MRISPTGEHTEVTRGTEADEEVAELTTDDLISYDAGEAEGEMCTYCYCDDITAENPIASLPGCTQHKCCASGCLERVKAKVSGWGVCRCGFHRLPIAPHVSRPRRGALSARI